MRVDQVNATSGVFVAARVNDSGCTAFLAKGVFFFVLFSEQRWLISYDLGRSNILILLIVKGQWNTGVPKSQPIPKLKTVIRLLATRTLK